MGDCIIIKVQYCAVDIAISLKMEAKRSNTDSKSEINDIPLPLTGRWQLALYQAELS